MMYLKKTWKILNNIFWPVPFYRHNFIQQLQGPQEQRQPFDSNLLVDPETDSAPQLTVLWKKGDSPKTVRQLAFSTFRSALEFHSLNFFNDS